MRLQKHTVAIHIFMIVLISLVGIGIRMSTWQRTLLTITTTDHRPLTTNHHRILLGFDPYYHLRRGDLAAAGLPIPRIDYYSAYPFGAQSHWPKPFDIYLSLFLRAGRRVIPSASPESAAGFAPVVLAILSLWA
nr:hypothetical protein [bacterium]